MIVTGVAEVFLVIFNPVEIEGFPNDTGFCLCMRSNSRRIACTILNMVEGEFRGLGLIGCGMMGGHYADAVSRIDGAEIIACCDPTAAKLEEFTANTNIRRSYLDYRTMIRDVRLDGIFNVTPDHLHFETASAVLEAGIPLMTEKPLAVGIDECRRLKKIAQKAAVPIVVNFSKRHTAAMAVTRAVLSSGCLGEPIRIEAAYQQGWVYTRDWGNWEDIHSWTWRMDKSIAPLGVLSDLGSHIVDLVRYITGREIISVAGAVAGVADKGRVLAGAHRLDSTDFAQAILTLEGNIPAAFTASRIDTGEKDTVCATIYCKFVRILNGEKCPAPGLDDGLKVQAVLEAIQTSAENNGIPVTPEGII
jgi:predicted dehydrogenase